MKPCKSISLISAGIDSPVATYLMKKKGLDIIAVHFVTNPSNKLLQDKTIEICTKLGLKRLYMVRHTFLSEKDVMQKCDDRSRCVLCKRMMVRMALRIAEKEKCKCLITGENIGQVASQTLDNMFVITSASPIPILRPLLCSDKQEIVDLAKEIGTYELSVEAASCCAAVPKQPATKSVITKIEFEETKLDVASMIEKSVAEAKVFDL